VEKEIKNRDIFMRQDNTTDLYLDTFDITLKAKKLLKKKKGIKFWAIDGMVRIGKGYVRMRDVPTNKSQSMMDLKKASQDEFNKRSVIFSNLNKYRNFI